MGPALTMGGEGGVEFLAQKKRRGTMPAPDRRVARESYFMPPRIASFAAFATRNFTTRFAAILIGSPVAGLRPIRALRLTRTIFPSPGIVNEFLASLCASAASSSRNCVATLLVTPVFFAR